MYTRERKSLDTQMNENKIADMETLFSKRKINEK